MDDARFIYKQKSKISRLVLIVLYGITLTISTHHSAQARDYFNPALLELNNPTLSGTDLSLFEVRGSQIPGKYHVDIYLNGEMLSTQELDFDLQKDATGESSLQPCLSSAQLTEFGIKLATPLLRDNTQCVDLPQTIPNAKATLNFNRMRLELSIPQISINRQARGYVSPEKWEQGIPTLLMNYNFSGAKDIGSNTNGDNYYLNLRSGLNIGAWRLRNYSTWNRTSTGQSSWKSINSYLQRDIIALKSQLILGDSSSPSDVFDSVPFRGAQLSSDDEMLPDSLKGFAPVVRGIAKSNAEVTVEQNGYIIYQSYVAPGSFEINDLYPTGGSGDLDVTIKEADGSEQHIVVPFATVPILQREGRLKFSTVTGVYRPADNNSEHYRFIQGTAIYGLPWGATIYGGIQSAEYYNALSLGVGKNLGTFGAVSADVTQSRSQLNMRDDKEQGQSWRIRYGKNILESGTNFTLASYRYSTAGYYTLQETLDTFANDDSRNQNEHKKSRAEVSLSQNLWEGFGGISLSLAKDSYWNSNRSTTSSTIGYNNSWQGINFGLNYSYNKNSYENNYYNEQIFAFNISMSLSQWLPGSYVSYNTNTSTGGNSSQNLSLTGSALERNNLNYNINQSDDAGNVSVNYRGGYGEANVGYSYGTQQNRVNYGLKGGVVVHEDGITLSQSLGETMVLVKAPGAANASVSGYSGIKTDWRGYAVVPYASPYRKNSVYIDSSSLAEDVDMQSNSASAIPTRGALARVVFKANVGQRVLMTLLRDGNQPVPFGAIVSNTGDEEMASSIVGDAGQVYLSGMENKGVLAVKWGNLPSQQCRVNYMLKEPDKNKSIQFTTQQCQVR